MAEEDLSQYVEALAIDDDEGTVRSEEPQSPFNLELQRGVDLILERYPTRQAWQDAKGPELNDLSEAIQHLYSQITFCLSVHARVRLTLGVRHTLIRNNYGNITAEMMSNQEEWHDYLVRIDKGEPHARIALQWLSLLVDEYERRKVIFQIFWSLMEDFPKCDKGAFQKMVSYIAYQLFRREDFLLKKYNDAQPSFEDLFDKPPKWFKWNVIPLEED